MEGDEAPNFCLPLRDLESPRVALTPFIPLQHAQAFFDASKSHPELYRYLPFGPFATSTEFVKWYKSSIQPDPTFVFFAIFDKTRPPHPNRDHSSPTGPAFPGAFAGLIGLINTATAHSSTEIGAIIILPEFQRTHVNRNANGLLLHYCLDLPAQGGLGLRRIQWQTDADNLRSVRAAEGLGFISEGIIRWHRVLPSDKEGKQARDSDPIKGHGRHTALLAICWDDWETVRERVDTVMKQGIS